MRNSVPQDIQVIYASPDFQKEIARREKLFDEFPLSPKWQTKTIERCRCLSQRGLDEFVHLFLYQQVTFQHNQREITRRHQTNKPLTYVASCLPHVLSLLPG